MLKQITAQQVTERIKAKCGSTWKDAAADVLCANWLRTFISEAPIQFIEAGEPFWRTI